MARAKVDADELLPGVDDGAFHRQEIRAQRAGMIGLATFLVAGLLGAFGSGPLSDARARAPDGKTAVEYQRMARAASPTELHLTAVHGGGDGLRVWLDRAFTDAIELERIVPEPERVALAPERMELEFAVAASPGPGPFAVVIKYQPRAMGRIAARVGVAGSAPVRFSQLIFP